LYVAVLWTALTLLPPRPKLIEAGSALRALAWLTLGLVGLTIVAGGFVAGLHAGLTYNTFPLMDGRLVPDGYADLSPFARNLIANIAAVQFNHRLLASLTALAAAALMIAAWPNRDRLGWRAALVGGAVLLQYGLGVTTLLLVVPVGLAVAHQICATILLTSVLLVAHALRHAPSTSPRPMTFPGHGQTEQGTPFYGSVMPSATQGSGAPGSATPGSVTEDPTP
jgi:cytochrome c oxidase assembly protein subunit 15